MRRRRRRRIRRVNQSINYIVNPRIRARYVGNPGRTKPRTGHWKTPYPHLLCTIDAKYANRFVGKSYPRDLGGRIAVAVGGGRRFRRQEWQQYVRAVSLIRVEALSIATDIFATHRVARTFAGAWKFRIRMFPAVEPSCNRILSETVSYIQ